MFCKTNYIHPRETIQGSKYRVQILLVAVGNNPIVLKAVIQQYKPTHLSTEQSRQIKVKLRDLCVLFWSLLQSWGSKDVGERRSAALSYRKKMHRYAEHCEMILTSLHPRGTKCLINIRVERLRAEGNSPWSDVFSQHRHPRWCCQMEIYLFPKRQLITRRGYGVNRIRITIHVIVLQMQADAGVRRHRKRIILERSQV